MSTTSPLMEHLNANLVDDGFQMCDSPSGSSTSEPHDEPHKQSLFYKLDNIVYIQQQNKQPSLSPPLSLPSPTDPLLPQNNHWSNDLTKNFTADYLSTPLEPGMQIRVLGVPQTGAKSRVETQIKLCIQLVTDNGDKVQKWTHVKLPDHMVAMKRQINNATAQPDKTLFLSARVICASDPSRKVTPCLGCIQRERKRLQRRKEGTVKLEQDDVEILLFNCSEIVDFSAGDTILPTRITCYCRHHNEKLGFCIYFQVHDHLGKQLATGMSPPIMITDDHKSNKLKPGRKRPRTNEQMAGPSQYPIQPRPPRRPTIQRLIPSEGPTYGGVEVTILGSNFRSGLTCMFGDVPAATTHFWSQNTLVCILPPATDPGTVVVSFKEYQAQDVTLFTYFNESDRALMELALQVVGLKMTGKVEDAREIAMRIVQGGNNPSTDVSQQHTMNLEYQIMQIIKVMQTTRHVNSMDVSVVNAQGHSMLHLACMLGYSQLVQYLIDMECRVNATDKNGFTALHFAAWFNHEQIVSVLLEEGNADPEISNRWNRKPIHLTESSAIQYKLKYHQIYTDDEDWISETGSLSDDEPTLQHYQIQTIHYLDDEESPRHSTEDIPDVLPVHSEKEMTWMQRAFTSDNSFLQNFMPASDLKTITDNLPTSFSSIFGKKQEATEQVLAWYMALAYAMGAKSLDEEEPETDTASIASQEVCAKRRDKRLFSFWVPLLCLMVSWLIFQFISSNPSVVDTIIGISGFRKQYLTVH